MKTHDTLRQAVDDLGQRIAETQERLARVKALDKQTNTRLEPTPNPRKPAMKTLTTSVLILLWAATAYAQVPAVVKGSYAEQRALQQHGARQRMKEFEKYGAGPIPPKVGSPDWIKQTFGDQKVLKNRQKYKKWQTEEAKKQKAKVAAAKKAKR